jgi:hypothetical protein
MQTMMSACGVMCSECPAYHGATKGAAHQAETSEAWQRIYGVAEEPADIACAGCLGPDAALFHTSVTCAARRCCLGKGFTSCAECPARPCALLERAQTTWDEVPEIGSHLSHAEFVRFARAYCGHRARVVAAAPPVGALPRSSSSR